MSPMLTVARAFWFYSIKFSDRQCFVICEHGRCWSYDLMAG